MGGDGGDKGDGGGALNEIYFEFANCSIHKNIILL
jgi:hypothetical protein